MGGDKRRVLTAYDSIADPILVLKSCGEILFANKAACVLFGYDDHHVGSQSQQNNAASKKKGLLGTHISKLLPDLGLGIGGSLNVDCLKPLGPPPSSPVLLGRFMFVNVGGNTGDDGKGGITTMAAGSFGSTSAQFGKRNVKAKSRRGERFLVQLAVSRLPAEAVVISGGNGGSGDLERATPFVFTLKKVDAVKKPSVPSRYKNEFEELNCLGKGGFGVVYRARNKLDGQEYAIKKVKLTCPPEDLAFLASSNENSNSNTPGGPLNGTLGSRKSSHTLSQSQSQQQQQQANRMASTETLRASKIMLNEDQPQNPGSSSASTPASQKKPGHRRRLSESDTRLLTEVKLFARLANHPNIVNYHTAWIEAVDDEEERDSGGNGDGGASETEDEMDDENRMVTGHTHASLSTIDTTATTNTTSTTTTTTTSHNDRDEDDDDEEFDVDISFMDSEGSGSVTRGGGKLAHLTPTANFTIPQFNNINSLDQISLLDEEFAKRSRVRETALSSKTSTAGVTTTITATATTTIMDNVTSSSSISGFSATSSNNTCDNPKSMFRCPSDSSFATSSSNASTDNNDEYGNGNGGSASVTPRRGYSDSESGVDFEHEHEGDDEDDGGRDSSNGNSDDDDGDSATAHIAFSYSCDDLGGLVVANNGRTSGVSSMASSQPVLGRGGGGGAVGGSGSGGFSKISGNSNRTSRTSLLSASLFQQQSLPVGDGWSLPVTGSSGNVTHSGSTAGSGTNAFDRIPIPTLKNRPTSQLSFGQVTSGASGTSFGSSGGMGGNGDVSGGSGFGNGFITGGRASFISSSSLSTTASTCSLSSMVTKQKVVDDRHNLSLADRVGLPLSASAPRVGAGAGIGGDERVGDGDWNGNTIRRSLKRVGKVQVGSVKGGAGGLGRVEDGIKLQQVDTTSYSPQRDLGGGGGGGGGKKKSSKPKHSATLYIQMQLCPYLDLRSFIGRCGKDVDRGVNLVIFRQIVDGLMHIHSQNVIHRDLKPDNIFVEEDHHVLLGDFGLAKSIADHVLSPHTDLDVGVDSSTDQGTYFYIAPEILDRQICTPRSDIYSLGILLLELFHPFGTAMERVVTLHEVKRSGALPATLPTDIGDLIERMLQKDPSMRPSAFDILNDPIFDTSFSYEMAGLSPLPMPSSFVSGSMPIRISGSSPSSARLILSPRFPESYGSSGSKRLSAMGGGVALPPPMTHVYDQHGMQHSHHVGYCPGCAEQEMYASQGHHALSPPSVSPLGSSPQQHHQMLHPQIFSAPQHSGRLSQYYRSVSRASGNADIASGGGPPSRPMSPLSRTLSGDEAAQHYASAGSTYQGPSSMHVYHHHQPYYQGAHHQRRYVKKSVSASTVLAVQGANGPYYRAQGHVAPPGSVEEGLVGLEAGGHAGGPGRSRSHSSSGYAFNNGAPHQQPQYYFPQGPQMGAMPGHYDAHVQSEPHYLGYGQQYHLHPYQQTQPIPKQNSYRHGSSSFLSDDESSSFVGAGPAFRVEELLQASETTTSTHGDEGSSTSSTSAQNVPNSVWSSMGKVMESMGSFASLVGSPPSFQELEAAVMPSLTTRKSKIGFLQPVAVASGGASSNESVHDQQQRGNTASASPSVSPCVEDSERTVVGSPSPWDAMSAGTSASGPNSYTASVSDGRWLVPQGGQGAVVGGPGASSSPSDSSSTTTAVSFGEGLTQIGNAALTSLWGLFKGPSKSRSQMHLSTAQQQQQQHHQQHLQGILAGSSSGHHAGSASAGSSATSTPVPGGSYHPTLSAQQQQALRPRRLSSPSLHHHFAHQHYMSNDSSYSVASAHPSFDHGVGFGYSYGYGHHNHAYGYGYPHPSVPQQYPAQYGHQHHVSSYPPPPQSPQQLSGGMTQSNVPVRRSSLSRQYSSQQSLNRSFEQDQLAVPSHSPAVVSSGPTVAFAADSAPANLNEPVVLSVPLGDSAPLAPGETPRDRIRALEKDVSVLVARLEAMHARQMAMEAELEGRGVTVGVPPVVVMGAGDIVESSQGEMSKVEVVDINSVSVGEVKFENLAAVPVTVEVAPLKVIVDTNSEGAMVAENKGLEGAAVDLEVTDSTTKAGSDVVAPTTQITATSGSSTSSAAVPPSSTYGWKWSVGVLMFSTMIVYIVRSIFISNNTGDHNNTVSESKGNGIPTCNDKIDFDLFMQHHQIALDSASKLDALVNDVQSLTLSQCNQRSQRSYDTESLYLSICTHNVTSQKEQNWRLPNLPPKLPPTSEVFIETTVHTIWGLFDDGHKPNTSIFEYWKLQNPDYQTIIHTKEDCDELVSSKYAWLQDIYEEMSPIEQADLLRLLVVHAYGGIYADLDVYPSTNFTNTLMEAGFDHRIHEFVAFTEVYFLDDVIFGREYTIRQGIPEINTRIANYLLYAAKGSKVLYQVILMVIQRVHRVQRMSSEQINSMPSQYTVLYSSGPDAVTEALFGGPGISLMPGVLLLEYDVSKMFINVAWGGWRREDEAA
ncbi:hypothetical protein HDU76_006646 [Blyttiomyces sp. JEL0837]|nr:hypothetical protein HDU76_006646 [Blyttiomyces sp. JEL0837]